MYIDRGLFIFIIGIAIVAIITGTVAYLIAPSKQAACNLEKSTQVVGQKMAECNRNNTYKTGDILQDVNAQYVIVCK